VSVWTAVLLAGAGCFALRFGIVTLVDRRPLPAWFEAATVFVIPGSLAGLCAVVLIAPITSGGAGPTVVVAAGTTVVVARRRSSAVALACGMAVIWIAGLAG
jgi:branched-subunit amino acid transport protein